MFDENLSAPVAAVEWRRLGEMAQLMEPQPGWRVRIGRSALSCLGASLRAATSEGNCRADPTGPDNPPSPAAFLLTFYRTHSILLLMGNTTEIPYGTLDLMVLKTLASLGSLHGYGIARRIEQVAEGSLALNQGTIYPALLRLEQRGWIASEWGSSENNRRARFYSITKAGCSQLAAESASWSRTVAMMNRLLETNL